MRACVRACVRVCVCVCVLLFHFVFVLTTQNDYEGWISTQAHLGKGNNTVLLTSDFVSSELTSFMTLDKKAHCVADKASEWEQQLKDDPDKAFLLAGIKNGFRITSKIAETEAKNHKSATLHSRRTLVEKELKIQIEHGNYVIASKKPAIISPLGAIPKDDGPVRLIHDGSLPEGFSMNGY